MRLWLATASVSAAVMAASLIALQLVPAQLPAPRRTSAGAPIVKLFARHPISSCAGFCVDRDLLVWPDGRVEFRIGAAEMITRDVPQLAWKERYRFEVTPAELSRFLAALAPVRPKGWPAPVGDCAATAVPAFDIIWVVPTKDRLIVCTSQRANDAVREAEAALGIQDMGVVVDQMGNRVTPVEHTRAWTE